MVWLACEAKRASPQVSSDTSLAIAQRISRSLHWEYARAILKRAPDVEDRAGGWISGSWHSLTAEWWTVVPCVCSCVSCLVVYGLRASAFSRTTGGGGERRGGRGGRGASGKWHLVLWWLSPRPSRISSLSKARRSFVSDSSLSSAPSPCRLVRGLWWCFAVSRFHHGSVHLVAARHVTPPVELRRRLTTWAPGHAETTPMFFLFFLGFEKHATWLRADRGTSPALERV